MSAVILRPELVVTVNVPSSLATVGGKLAESFAKDELDATIDKLLAQFGAEVGTEPVAEYVVGEVEERDVLVGPPCGDLAGELDPDGPRANEQNPVRT